MQADFPSRVSDSIRAWSALRSRDATREGVIRLVLAVAVAAVEELGRLTALGQAAVLAAGLVAGAIRDPQLEIMSYARR